MSLLTNMVLKEILNTAWNIFNAILCFWNIMFWEHNDLIIHICLQIVV